MSPIPKGPHLGVLAKTRPQHHSGPVRGVVPGTTRIRETTAIGGHGADRWYWPNPSSTGGRPRLQGRTVRKASVVPHPPGWATWDRRASTGTWRQRGGRAPVVCAEQGRFCLLRRSGSMQMDDPVFTFDLRPSACMSPDRARTLAGETLPSAGRSILNGRPLWGEHVAQDTPWRKVLA